MKDPKDILINGVQLSIILESHKKWWLSQEGGKRADLRGAYLRGVDLQGVDLRGADLRGVDLQGADLQGVDLRGADLRGVDLQGAYLRGVDLRGVDLRGAYLRGAYLRGVDLRGADLQGVDLQGVDLRGVKNIEFATALVTIVPDGDIIGWKKLQNGLIAKLLIPTKAKRSNASGRKCRAEFAKVLEVWNGDEKVKTGNSSHDESFVYTVGKIVKPDSWDDNRWEECSGGIHFFITRIEAENY